MSEPVTKRQPMIDLDEFERQLRRPRSISQTDGETLAELVHLFGSRPASREDTVFEPRGEPSAHTFGLDAQAPLISGDFAAIEAALLGAQYAAPPEPVPDASAEPSETEEEQTPLISGDFSAIEAGLLSALQRDAGSAPSAVESPSFFPLAVETSDLLNDLNDTTSPQFIGEEVRSHRPLYIMAAIVFAGIAGIVGVVAHSGSKRAVSGESQIATIKPEPGPAKSVVAAAPSAALSKAAEVARDLANNGLAGGNAAAQGVPMQGAAIQASSDAVSSPQPSSAAIAGQEKTPPRVISLTAQTAPASARQPMAAASSIFAPPAQGAGAQSLTAPTEGAAAIEPKKVKTAAVRPDGSLISEDSRTQNALLSADVARSPLPKASSHAASSHAAEAASPAAPPSEEHAAKAPASKAAAKTSSLRTAHHATKAKLAVDAALNNRSRSAHKATIAAAKPASVAAANPPVRAETAAVASAPVQTQPASTAANPMGIVNLAVNSITGATSKILDWGHSAVDPRN